jgi:hypothetical protein
MTLQDALFRLQCKSYLLLCISDESFSGAFFAFHEPSKMKNNTGNKPTIKVPKAERKPLDPVEAFRIYAAATDDVLLPPEVVAPIIGRDSIATLEKMRHLGEGPRFCKTGRLTRYRAGDVRAYLASLETHTITP